MTRSYDRRPTVDTTATAKARVIADLRASFGELKCIGSERLVRLGISMTQLHVLHLLDRHGEMAMSRLADMLDVSMSAATGLVDRIEEHGYVERIRVPSDRRIVLARHRPTPDASCSTRHRLGADRVLDRILDGLDATQLTATRRGDGRIFGPPSTRS